MDCCNLANVILDHHIAPRISGNRRLFNLLLVVEFDLPWNSTQVDDYGASFQAWNSEEFTKAWNAVRRALPHNQLACVVLCFSLFFFASARKILYGIFQVENLPKILLLGMAFYMKNPV